MHDSQSFRPLETLAFDGTAEQCFLVGYRALCHEIYQKSGSLNAYPVVRRLVDRGASVEAQKHIQEMWMAMETGARKGLGDFLKTKTVMDEKLIQQQYPGWSRAIVRFRGGLSVASTGVVSPNRDLDGQRLQTLHDADADIEELLFGVLATVEGGAAIFIWQTNHLAPREFMRSLLKKDRRLLPSFIVQFMFAYIENTYFSNEWWQSMRKMNREHIEYLAGIGNAYYTDFRYSTAKFVPWEITNVTVTDS